MYYFLHQKCTTVNIIVRNVVYCSMCDYNINYIFFNLHILITWLISEFPGLID